MLSRVFLAAGVAALAIAAPAFADKGGGGHGGGGGNGHGGGGQPAFNAGGGGGGRGHGGEGGGEPSFNFAGGGGGRGHGGGGGGQPAFNYGGGGGRGHGGGGGFSPQTYFGGGGGHGHGGGGQRIYGGGGGGHGHGGGDRQVVFQGGGHGEGHGGGLFEGGGHGRSHGGGFSPQMHAERQQGHGFEHQQAFQHGHGIEHQQAFATGHGFEHQQAADFEHNPQFDRVRQQFAAHNPFYADRIAAFHNAETSFFEHGDGARALGLIDGCPPGLWMKGNGCMPPGQAARLLGAPLAAANGLVPLGILPQPLSYFYPDTTDYYYRYGNGYLYQVDRDTQMIASLLPLIGGGYVPGQYLPASYMGSYVPSYYGFDSFYPDNGGLCNRYEYGVVYQVDCRDGYVENVIPMYAGGYGVGQLLPSAYNYYNVPMQYRDLYYDTPDAGYWYSPGAIYQYDPRSSVITSVAALMSPGFTVGQPLPAGYGVYNVPYDYRATYYDTPNAWYRYNNGYIYQVDPVTQVVTAIVASLLT